MTEQNNLIHPETTIGFVHLDVSSLERSLEFYQQVLGFSVRKPTGQTAWLGASDSGPDLLALTENSTGLPPGRTTGLYHFAILVPSRVDLANSLQHLVAAGWRPQGYADHLVSEAIYLADPDENGIEIYRDRPRNEWPMAGGQVQMGSEPIDLRGLLAEANPDLQAWKGMAAGTRIGHMHLKVSNLAAAQDFYTGVLGFGLMQRYGPSASFVSAGGYHHHIGMNTWESAGATPPPPGSLGMRYFSVKLPGQEALQAVFRRLQNAGCPVENTGQGWMVEDPSRNHILFV